MSSPTPPTTLPPEAPPSCPLCGLDLHAPAASIEVCGGCHQSLVGSSAGAVTQTGEFRVPAGFYSLQVGKAIPGAAAGDRSRCSWCQRPADTVKKLLSAGDARICNECVALCVDIMTAELGDGWRR